VSASASPVDNEAAELTYETVDWKPAEGGRPSEALYEDYTLQSIRIPGAQAHPTRRGWFLGDSTGCGKGRQVAGIILDNWLKGRRRAFWISKSEALIEQARRDWSALGQERLLIQPLARFRQGTPIRLDEGILFVTYATLRSGRLVRKAPQKQGLPASSPSMSAVTRSPIGPAAPSFT
jgi:hypothetical protein